MKHLRFARDKPCSLLQKFANYGCKKFYNIATRGQCYKTFLYDIYEFLQPARVFVSGKLFKPSLMLADNPRSLTTVKHLRLAREKHCILLQKFANYGCKKFYDIVTSDQCYKTFLYDIYEFLQPARVFVSGKLFKPSLMFVGNPRSLTRVKHLRLARDKHCSLLQKFAN